MKELQQESLIKQGEIILYNLNETISLDVHIENETVWLTQAQMADLFGVKQPAISKHLNNIFKEKELDKFSVYSILEYTATDGKIYKTQFYNLDAILSVGYRVNSKNATLFRQWANKVLKEYLLKGYSVNQEFQEINNTLQSHTRQITELNKKVDFFVQTSLPPIQGLFYNGQIFDAYKFANDLIRSAQKRIILIDNYVDDLHCLCLQKGKRLFPPFAKLEIPADEFMKHL
ncbi:MAG: virulence RhuM family protein [Bacteroidales bacterium]|nr:virulence RhuM family protein [Bacteroidales bacterium]